ncbi:MULTISPECIES: GatB/YqeY domain-containing protein [Capnocytophaga]|uniref:Glutamyl-tRNA amidotransferase n=1 Tax=Capnocytophaga canis TaxID=1848903 RepID=A0A0B7HT82_9FLAO|nr:MULTISPECIES: GatB/YqeY domain-containing protein [Capnocytophaga]ATA73720.1 glutamyl-tRNA amidotransferase [Capnocytophaga sp. H4358]RIY36558.1 glutamyl-tRNA amidotransferase [Capnocytophaga canis]CEN42545.1 YqeY-like protein [Capnocytophaga canis]CEN53848.1 YqeY-like protein [Capnocytophaga canis]GIM60565.1 aspartyl-tRNA amidotransferase subunit B [Capnocytophaga canis]
MSLQTKVMEALKDAMKSKDSVALESLRAIKSAILLAKTESGASEELSESQELVLLQKLIKQRRDSATLYASQGRNDLAEPELAQIKVIERFLPELPSEEEIEAIIKKIISETGASGMKDMGKVMGVASTELAGKADNRVVSTIVKKLLS